jgi:hypothetical protein
MIESSRSRRLKEVVSSCSLFASSLEKVQDVVDDAQHLPRRGVGGAQEVVLVRRQLRVHQQLEHRDDAVERRADLVAHGGEELALGHHRALGGLLGLDQLALEVAVDLQLGVQRLHHFLLLLGLGRDLVERLVPARGGAPQPAIAASVISAATKATVFQNGCW